MAALKINLKEFLSEHYALLSILVGSGLFAFSLGPFSNFDANLEFEVTSNVIKTGMPYMSTGFLINQPPIAFYINAVFLRIFGLSFNVGVNVVTVFSLGCVLLVYLIGKAWYGKTTGLFASALFALTPWQVVFSRSFLIDTQSLFFSLLCLLIGIYAVRKDSLKLFMLSAVVFGLAFLTKFFAVFILIPMALFYFRYRQKALRRRFVPATFFAPLLLFMLLWYQGIKQTSLLTALWHDDFNHFIPAGLVPSPFFVGSFLVQTLGISFIALAVISLVFTLSQRKFFKNVLAVDLICLAMVFVVAGVDTFMAVGLNLRSPYSSPMKYNYQLLPFICLLAASLLDKSKSLLSTKNEVRPRKLLFALAIIGAVLLVATIFSNMYSSSSFGGLGVISFNVEGDAYSFENSAQTQTAGLVFVQYLGLALVVSGFMWAVKDPLMASLNWIEKPRGDKKFQTKADLT